MNGWWCVLLALVCGACRDNPTHPAPDRAAESAVYSAVLAAQVVAGDTTVPVLVRRSLVRPIAESETRRDGEARAALLKRLVAFGVPRDLANTLLDAPAGPFDTSLVARAPLAVTMEPLVPGSQADSADRRRYIQAIAPPHEPTARYRWVGLSRIAFSEDGTQAAVYVEMSCGWTCGSFAVYVLRRQAGQWVISDVLTLAVA